MNPSPTIKPGTIVQIDPETDVRPNFRACLAIVEDVRQWGVIAYIQSTDDEGGGRIYLRLNWVQFEPCGMAVWLAAN